MRGVVGRNRVTFIGIGMFVLSVLLAVTTRLALLGILPLLLSFWAFRRKEALAPLARVGALVALVVSVITLTQGPAANPLSSRPAAGRGSSMSPRLPATSRRTATGSYSAARGSQTN